MQRRTFLKSAATLAAAPALSPLAGAAAQNLPAVSASSARSFPRDFIWGTATAAYQVEGAVHEDGRGPSVWDTYSHTPGKTFQGQTADVTDDFYHRYKEDIASMQRLGVKGFRFSIAWPRIFPTGTGTPNPKGIDFYKRLTDALLAANIEPFCTLYHWDLPQALQDKGGWTNPDIPRAFADYAHYTVSQLSDRISQWMTINEFGSYIDAGYQGSDSPPDVRLPRQQFMQTRHYAVLGHGLAVQAVRAAATRPVQVGLAEDISGAMPAIEDAAHIRAAESALREFNAQYITVILEGRYTDHYLESLGADAPHFTPDELKIIASPLDFLGINVYTTQEVVPSDSPTGFESVPRPSTYPHASSEWLYFNPQALYWTPKLVSSLWGVQHMYITENGYSSNDILEKDPQHPDGRVLDSDRVNYLRNYLTQLQRGVAEGIPVHGYFLWSLLDNYEWDSGFSKRFGITYVDFTTQKRTPKLSYDFYKEVIRSNSVV
ncbi:MAG TPA: GH1 family beta-glucosidase [Acidobacteriaceae bacterium]|jgi:beta-glucosidase|nr:GH1 family beta-glucosidase [Acidobacteriaceae bacterium]